MLFRSSHVAGGGDRLELGVALENPKWERPEYQHGS